MGKSAIAEGLAQKIASNDVPETLEGKRMITLDMGLLVRSPGLSALAQRRSSHGICENHDRGLSCHVSLCCCCCCFFCCARPSAPSAALASCARRRERPGCRRASERTRFGL